jgi:hypothetical protein
MDNLKEETDTRKREGDRAGIRQKADEKNEM